jgi:hypothetical protein
MEKKHDSDSDVIAFGTDPWLQVAGGDDTAVDLTQFNSSQFPAGVFAPVNSDYGIERLDEDEVFDSDFDAALALAEHLHGITD